MSPERYSIRLPAQLQSLQPATAFLREGAVRAGFAEARMLELDLILEELLVNVTSYAYKDEAEGDIEISYTVSDSALDVEITDRGVPFDPVSAALPDLDAPSQAGGLGIFLVRTLAESVTYHRMESKNVVRFRLSATT